MREAGPGISRGWCVCVGGGHYQRTCGHSTCRMPHSDQFLLAVLPLVSTCRRYIVPLPPMFHRHLPSFFPFLPYVNIFIVTIALGHSFIRAFI